MKPLDVTQPSNAFLLEWTSADNLSGVDYVEIQEGFNSGDWTTLPPVDGIETEQWIIGIPGSAYKYRMHGVDFSGNSESYPTQAEASTAVPEAEVLCSAPDDFDASGNNDNSPAMANMIYADGDSQVHNNCNPLTPNFQGDEDWAKLTVLQGEHYFIRSHANSIQTATVISVYAEDGSTLIAEAIPEEFGDSTYLIWTPDQDQTVYLRFRHLDGRVIGTSVASTISVSTGALIYIPFINK
jgi:hypothetical protein